MNDTTKQIMQEYLKQPTAWDPKTGNIKFDKAEAHYIHNRDILWFDNIYFPRILHIVKLCLALGVLQMSDCVLVDNFGINTTLAGLWPNEEIQDDFIDCFVPYFENLWYNCAYFDNFTKQDLVALNVSAPGIGKQLNLFG